MTPESDHKLEGMITGVALSGVFRGEAIGPWSPPRAQNLIVPMGRILAIGPILQCYGLILQQSS